MPCRAGFSAASFSAGCFSLVGFSAWSSAGAAGDMSATNRIVTASLRSEQIKSHLAGELGTLVWWARRPGNGV